MKGRVCFTGMGMLAYANAFANPGCWHGSPRASLRGMELRSVDDDECTKIRCRNNGSDGRPHNRRRLLQTISNSLLATAILIPTNANSACLAGDIRPDCIGVYKLPIDAPETPYMDTPEKLKVYAPDIKWVPPVEYPPNYADALNQLKQQRQKLDEAQDLVARGSIEGAGLVMLDIIPKTTAAGSVILKAYGKASNKERNAAMKRKTASNGNDGNPSSTPKATSLEMKSYRIEYALNELMGYLGEMDVLIGQGLRGELGVSAPAQIEILSNFKECTKEFDNLLLAVPEKLK